MQGSVLGPFLEDGVLLMITEDTRELLVYVGFSGYLLFKIKTENLKNYLLSLFKITVINSVQPRYLTHETQSNEQACPLLSLGLRGCVAGSPLPCACREGRGRADTS